MSFYKKSLTTLELPAVLQMLSAEAVSDTAKELALELEPSDDVHEVRRRLEETTAAKTMMTVRGGPGFSGVKDVRASLARADLGGALNTRELMDIARVLQCARLVRGYIADDSVGKTTIDSLFYALRANKFLEEKINTSIVGEDEIADSASPELTSIRRQMRAAAARARDVLTKIISSPSYAKALQEPIITMRSDRYVVPVKADHKGAVPGLVHDISASGMTLFIEPMGAVKANNELRELNAREKIEIDRILAELSADCAEHKDDIESDFDLLVRLDLIFAKAKLSYKLNCGAATLEDKGIVLRRARHPLLDQAKAVPISLELGDSFDTLVITGPNTGGKTVSLKTIGLLAAMNQCGLHIPASDGSNLPVFTHILADIGDEQSIEQSLSTFSSHMTNIVEIISCVQDNDLVLFDELGAGTDPTEGAALAQSILSSLLERKVRTMATTHYSELKAFALSTPGVENASVEFDVESLRPTYRLSIGIPGKSNAFDISRKLGLPERLIDGAKELLSKEDIRFEDVIANAEYHRQIAEREREIAEETRRETVKLRDEAERLRREIEQSRDKSLKKAKDEARRVLENARREADGIIRELKAMKKQAQTPEHEVQRLKKRMEDGIDALSEGLSEKSSVNFTPPKSVRPGDTVEIVHLGTKGTVLSPADRNGEVQIQAGIIKMKAHISQLRLVEPDKPKQSRVMNRVSAAKPAVPMEVDVRGMTLDEAIAAVDIYLADATLAGLNEVSIIHGKGTGVLRTGIQRHLRTHMNVRKYRDGMYGEGEQGVTVVTLK